MGHRRDRTWSLLPDDLPAAPRRRGALTPSKHPTLRAPPTLPTRWAPTTRVWTTRRARRRRPDVAPAPAQAPLLPGRGRRCRGARQGAGGGRHVVVPLAALGVGALRGPSLPRPPGERSQSPHPSPLLEFPDPQELPILASAPGLLRSLLVSQPPTLRSLLLPFLGLPYPSEHTPLSGHPQILRRCFSNLQSPPDPFQPHLASLVHPRPLETSPMGQYPKQPT